MPITFLHAADIHLDSPLRGLERYEGAPVDRIRIATRRAFDALIDTAIRRKVDFVLIAGDLYDGDWPDWRTGLYIVGRLSKLREAGIPAYLIAGNHDAANKMTKDLPLPANVKVFDPQRAETMFVDGIDAAIHGQSFATAAVTENLALGYPTLRRGCFNIGLLHTAVDGADGHDRYAPCTLDDLRSKGYDYWALGHVHTRRTLCDDPPIVFPGNVQGRHAREVGPKGCVLVTIHDDGRVTREFERLDVLRWERERVDLTDAERESDMIDRVVSVVENLLRSETDEDRLLIARLELHGGTSLNASLRARHEEFVNKIRAVAIDAGRDRLWLEKVEIKTEPPARSTAAFDGPIGEIQAILELFRRDATQLPALVSELTQLRAKLPDDFKNDPDIPRLDDRDWIESVLDQVEPLLIHFLLQSGKDGPS